MTNLVINTNMRTYMASVSWQYPQDQLIALRRQNAEAQAAQPVASGVDLANVNFRYAIEGDRAPWRPLRAFDDGRQVFIEFPRGIGQGEMPPLFVVGPEGNTSEHPIRASRTPGVPEETTMAYKENGSAKGSVDFDSISQTGCTSLCSPLSPTIPGPCSESGSLHSVL